jgi:hypothetical protein
VVAGDQLVVVIARWCPPFEGRMLQSRGRGCHNLPNELSGADRSLKNSVGAIGWSRDGRLSHEGRSRFPAGWVCASPFTRSRSPVPTSYNCFCPSLRGRIRPGHPSPRGRAARYHNGSYLVDSASSHMLVSKIKPCMSKYKQSYCETANGSLNQLSFI